MQEQIKVIGNKYNEAKLKFTNVMEGQAGFDSKLKSLNELADILGDDKKNIEDFENNIIRWVKAKNPELYKSYENDLKNAA